MNDEKTCKTCGASIPSDAPGGACPACLLGAGLQPEGGSDETPAEPFDREELAKLLPQFEIEAFVGQGGMGVVYRARQKALDRIVALKILTRDVAEDPAFAERFTREARALAALSHPNIVGVYEAGRAGDLWFLTMEYVDGVNLRQAEGAGRLSPAQALGIVPQICDALQYAHDEGVVHRDIKPENILLDRKGGVKIADFGLAKLVRPDPMDHTLTGTQQVMGTLHYIAPEQMRTPQEVDHRADIYSLGVVFYEMLTGDLPIGRFPNPSEKVEVDVRLDDVVLRTLERERDRRYQSVSEVKTRMEDIARTPEPVKVEGDVRVGPRSSRLSYMAVAGILCWPIAILFGLLLLNGGARDEIAMWSGFIVILTGVIFSYIARASIRRDPERLHGARLARIGLVVPLVLVGFAVLVSFLAFFFLMRVEPPDDSASIDAMVIEAQAKDYLARIDAMGGMAPPEDVVEMIDPRQREWFLGLSDNEFRRLRGEQMLGLAMLDLSRIPGKLGDYEVERNPVEDVDGRAQVTLNRQGDRIVFWMVRVNDEWFLEVGLVILPGHRKAVEDAARELQARAAALVERVNMLAGVTPVEELVDHVDPRKREWLTNLAEAEFRLHFQRQHLGLAFIDKYRLPAPLAAFEIKRVQSSDHVATITLTWQASRIEFGMVRVGDTWFLDAGPVQMDFPDLPRLDLDRMDNPVAQLLERSGPDVLGTLQRYVDPLKRIELRGLSEAEFRRRQEAGELGLAFRPEGWLPGVTKGFTTTTNRSEFAHGRGHVTVWTKESDHAVRYPVVRVEGMWFLGVGPMQKLAKPEIK